MDERFKQFVEESAAILRTCADDLEKIVNDEELSLFLKMMRVMECMFEGQNHLQKIADEFMMESRSVD